MILLGAGVARVSASEIATWILPSKTDPHVVVRHHLFAVRVGVGLQSRHRRLVAKRVSARGPHRGSVAIYSWSSSISRLKGPSIRKS